MLKSGDTSVSGGLKLRLGRLRQDALFFVSALVAAIVAVLALADHRQTKGRITRAETAQWYCEHKGTRCGGPDYMVIHAAWERRELRYKVAEGVLSFAVVIGMGWSIRLRRTG